MGVLGIGGLFLAPLWPLLRHSFPAWLLLPLPPATSDASFAMELSKRVVHSLFDWVGWAVWGGRVLSLGIECYFIGGLLRMLCEEDEAEERGDVDTSKKAS